MRYGSIVWLGCGKNGDITLAPSGLWRVWYNRGTKGEGLAAGRQTDASGELQHAPLLREVTHSYHHRLGQSGG